MKYVAIESFGNWLVYDDAGLIYCQATKHAVERDPTGEKSARLIADALNAFGAAREHPAAQLAQPAIDPLRAEYAARFMAAILGLHGFKYGQSYASFAAECVVHADALLAALRKGAAV
jgi:hypothetical protein